LRPEQLDAYLDIAREQGFDALIAIFQDRLDTYGDS